MLESDLFDEVMVPTDDEEIADDRVVERMLPEHEMTRLQDIELAFHDAGQSCRFAVAPFLRDDTPFGTDAAGLIDDEEDRLTAERYCRALARVA